MSFKVLIRESFPNFYSGLAYHMNDLRVFFARFYHMRNIKRIRNKVRAGKRVRVLFLDTDISKWKTQTVFRRMQAVSVFDPLIGISQRDIGDDIESAIEFYKSQGVPYKVIYDKANKRLTDFRKNIRPDIIFYQQPWHNDGEQSILKTHRWALPCYVPYFVNDYGHVVRNSRLTFHRFLAYFFQLNKTWVNLYLKGAPWWLHSGKMIPLGHPALDYLTVAPPPKPAKQCVIYAPHFSFYLPNTPQRVNISTFLENGREILAYAKKHRDMNWIFKPHPVLRSELVIRKKWTEDEVADYYGEWAKIGRVCTDSDYIKYFSESTTMITDCGSFLTEYGATGKPVIWLRASKPSALPLKPSMDIYRTYYHAHNLQEMHDLFNLVLERRLDPKFEERNKALRAAKIVGENAAENIVNYLCQEFGIEER